MERQWSRRSASGYSTALAYLVLIVAVAFGNLAVRYLDKIRGRQGAEA